jgi:DNA-binding CsgD family transcriptional regulator
MKKIAEFVSGLSLPACVITGSGELALVNPAMRRSHVKGAELSISGSCVFTPSKELNDCGNCSHYPVTKGRCVIPRVTPSSRLVMAVGLEKAEGATVAFYANGSAVNPLEAHAALGGILSLAGYGGEGKSHGAKFSAPARWEANVHLRQLVEWAVEGLETGGAHFDLKVSGEVSMDFASLSAARLVIRRMGAELLGLEPAGVLTARSFSKPGEGGITRVLSMQVDINRPAAKSLSSEISAMELRLSGYCLRLGRMMGFAIPAPHTLVGGGKADLRFELAGGFAASEGDLRKNGPDSVFQGLSSRERQVVEMVAAGFANDEISTKLGITVSTVKQHIKNIYRRTGMKSRSELVFRAGG